MTHCFTADGSFSHSTTTLNDAVGYKTGFSVIKLSSFRCCGESLLFLSYFQTWNTQHAKTFTLMFVTASCQDKETVFILSYVELDKNVKTRLPDLSRFLFKWSRIDSRNPEIDLCIIYIYIFNFWIKCDFFLFPLLLFGPTFMWLEHFDWFDWFGW